MILKEKLKNENIISLILKVYNDLATKYSKNVVIDLMCNIENLKEEHFNSSDIFILSKTYLTSELVQNCFSNIRYDELGSKKL